MTKFLHNPWRFAAMLSIFGITTSIRGKLPSRLISKMAETEAQCHGVFECRPGCNWALSPPRRGL